MNIGDAALETGVQEQTIRYYEAMGFIPPIQRGENGYRWFGTRDLSALSFITRARAVGFTGKEGAALAAMFQDTAFPSPKIKAIASKLCDRLETKIANLQSIHRPLEDLVARGQDDKRPNSPILDDIAVVGQSGED